MRLAILADIHGNASALEAALADALEARVERFLLLGDYVGYYYQPREVVTRLMMLPHDAVLGNHDRQLLNALDRDGTLEGYRAKYGSGLDVARSTLAPEHLAWLRALPDSRVVHLGLIDLMLCHGSPHDRDLYVYPDATPDVMDRCANVDADTVLMGHTHHAFVARCGAKWLVNPGSVGQARDLGGFASWALLDTRSGAITIRRSAYHVAPLYTEVLVRDGDWPSNASILVRNNPAQEAALRPRPASGE